MTVPLPNLDDRRWTDLVDEGRALIPVYAPEWTDHNAHDPGITLMELFAWIAEMNIYQLNRIPDLHKRKFLQLVGVFPRPPQPSRAALRFELDGPPHVELPASVQITGVDPGGTLTPFRTRRALTILPGQLQAVLSETDSALADLTAAWKRGEPLQLFGLQPAPGSTLYLGFSDAFPLHQEASLFFDTPDPQSDAIERERMLEEERSARESCRPPRQPCGKERTRHRPAPNPVLPPHHSVRLQWEVLAQAGIRTEWIALSAEDTTRAFTLAGSVHFTMPVKMAKATIGRIATPLYYVRCRLVSGAYDAVPIATYVSFNGVEVEQSVPVWTDWPIASDAVISGQPPAPGTLASFDFSINAFGKISSLTSPSAQPHAPKWLILAYAAPAGTNDGRLSFEGVRLTSGTGAPNQIVALPKFPVDVPTFELYTLESAAWTRWSVKPDLVASRASDPHVVIDAQAGTLSFGDGQRGRVPPADALMLASYRATRAELGRLGAHTIHSLPDAPHNKAIVPNLSAVRQRIVTIDNPAATFGGEAAETLTHAAGRAVVEREAPLRAVTSDDTEILAKHTPGVKLARVHAIANLHAGFPCVVAAGMLAVIVVPSLPELRPVPSGGLRNRVASYLQRRRVVGTRIEVIGPGYLEVGVRATVQAIPGGRTSSDLHDAVVAALNEFLDPLRGGPDRQGWPFGRDVYRSEVLQVIDQVPGVDYVVSLELLAAGRDPQCGNVCLGPTFLVTPGAHEIEVV